MPISDYFTDDQLSALKTLGLLSFGAGVATPLLREMVKRPSLEATTTTGGTIELPVPYYDDDIKGLDVSKKTYKYRPGKNLVVEKKAELSGQDLTNPYFVPGVVASLTLPALLSNYMVSGLLKDKNLEDYESTNKDEFAKALIEAHSNRVGHPITVEGKNSAPYEMVAGLNRLAARSVGGASRAAVSATKAVGNKLKGKLRGDSVDEEKVAHYKEADYWQDVKNYYNIGGNSATSAPSTSGAPDPTGGVMDEMWGYVRDKGQQIADFMAPYAKGYSGLLGGLALAGGILGTRYGYRKSKAEDTDTQDSYKYLAEFLRRQQEHGTPLYVTPKSVGYSGPNI